MRKFLIILLALLVLALSAVGCGKAPDQTTPPETESGSEILPGGTESGPEEGKEVTKMYITVNGNKLKVSLEKNSSTAALAQLLRQGDIVYTANDYGGFEKVGYLGHSLPTNNTQITTVAGDVILYSGNQIVLFYGSNSWSYTRLGKIEGYSPAELATLLGAGEGSIEVTLSLN